MGKPTFSLAIVTMSVLCCVPIRAIFPQIPLYLFFLLVTVFWTLDALVLVPLMRLPKRTLSQNLLMIIGIIPFIWMTLMILLWLIVGQAEMAPKVECFFKGDKYQVIHKQGAPKQGACRLIESN